MALLKSFRIEGLAGREDVCEKTLNQSVSVFFGPNGSGKTSLLRILHSALLLKGDLVKAVPFTKAEVHIQDYRGQEHVLRLDKSKPQTKRSTSLTSFLKGKVEELVWTVEPHHDHGWYHRFLPTSRLYTKRTQQTNLFATGAEADSDLETRFAESLADTWKEYSTDIALAVNRAQEEGLARILESVITDVESVQENEPTNPKAAYEAVSKFLTRRQMKSATLSQEAFLKRYKNNKQFRSVAKDIQSIERMVSYYAAPRENFKELVNEMLGGSKSVSYSDKEIEVAIREKKIPLSFLSSGEKQLLKIFVETLIAGVTVILVDEPEISMHVDWQRRLVACMRVLNPRVQIVLATHSPEIMADLPEDQIFHI